MRKVILIVGMFLLAVSVMFHKHQDEVKRNRSSFKAYLKKRQPLYKKKSLSKIPHSLPSKTSNSGPVRFQEARKTPRWAVILTDKFKRFHNEETKISVTEEREVFHGRYGKVLKQVLVHYERPQRENSFRALIDPKSGFILQTWDRTIYEKDRGGVLLDPPPNFFED